MIILGNSLFSTVKRQGLTPPLTVLQVGASAGQEIDDFYQSGVIAGLFIEPLDTPFAMLSDRCRGKPNYIPVQALALSEDNLISNFYLASNGGQSSSILPPKQHLLYYPNITFDHQIEMIGYKVDTLTAIAKQRFDTLPKYFDLFYLDVQGAELEVMKGSVSQLQNGKYVYAEIGDGNLYEGDVKLVELITFLRLFGYRPIALEANGQNGSGDCLWYKH